METLDCTKFHIQMKNSHSGGKNSHSAEKIHIQKTQILDPECGITHAECGKNTGFDVKFYDLSIYDVFRAFGALLRHSGSVF